MDMKKLEGITSELVVGKNRTNNFGKYNYRNAEDILTALKPLCTKYGAALIVQDDIVQIGTRYYVQATVTLYDADNGEQIAQTHAYAREADKLGGMSDGQITGATSSYARKYALAAMFNLSPSDDDEAVGEPDGEPPNAQPRRQAGAELKRYCEEAGLDYSDVVRVCFGGQMSQQKEEYGINNWNKLVNYYMEHKDGGKA